MAIKIHSNFEEGSRAFKFAERDHSSDRSETNKRSSYFDHAKLSAFNFPDLNSYKKPNKRDIERENYNAGFIKLSELQEDDFSHASLRARADNVKQWLQDEPETDVGFSVKPLIEEFQQLMTQSEVKSRRITQKHPHIYKLLGAKQNVDFFFNEISHSLPITHSLKIQPQEICKIVETTEKTWKECFDECSKLADQSIGAPAFSGERAICVEVLKVSSVGCKRCMFIIPRKYLTPKALETVSRSFGKHNAVKVSETLCSYDALSDVILGDEFYTHLPAKKSPKVFLVDGDNNILNAQTGFERIL